MQNLWILLASYFFYGNWDWRFLSLIFASTIVDYFVGIGCLKLQERKGRKTLLLFSLIFNIGILGIFKYYNFFIENLTEFFSFFGQKISISSLNLILPVGISFYTFQTLSYSIDVYQKKLSLKPILLHSQVSLVFSLN